MGTFKRKLTMTSMCSHYIDKTVVKTSHSIPLRRENTKSPPVYHWKEKTQSLSLFTIEKRKKSFQLSLFLCHSNPSLLNVHRCFRIGLSQKWYLDCYWKLICANRILYLRKTRTKWRIRVNWLNIVVLTFSCVWSCIIYYILDCGGPSVYVCIYCLHPGCHAIEKIHTVNIHLKTYLY